MHSNTHTHARGHSDTRTHARAYTLYTFTPLNIVFPHEQIAAQRGSDELMVSQGRSQVVVVVMVHCGGCGALWWVVVVVVVVVRCGGL